MNFDPDQDLVFFFVVWSQDLRCSADRVTLKSGTWIRLLWEKSLKWVDYFANPVFENLGIHIKRKILARPHLVFYKIKKVANIWITFKISSDAIMTSIITKKESEASAILDTPF